MREQIKPIAYLYSDAPKPELANPLIHSALLCFASERNEMLAGETPLYTKDQLAQPVIDEARLRELLKSACDANWDDGFERVSTSIRMQNAEQDLIDYVMGRAK